MHPSILSGKPPMEPYRIFFPLGILLGLLGVSVWPIYWLGWGIAPSLAGHVGLQIQGFVLAFAMGFLMTAVPKFVGAPPVPVSSQVVVATPVVVSAVGFWLDRPVIAESGFLLALVGLIVVLGRRFRARIASPPESMAAVALGLAAGVAGGCIKLGVVLGWLDPGLILLGRRLLSEGMILLFVIGIGGKLVPLLLGHPTRLPKPRWTYLAAGLLVLGSIVAQYGFGLEWAVWLRAIAVIGIVGWNSRLWHLPRTRSALSFGVYLSHWMLVAGMLWVAILPPFRVEGLHLIFVGGFSILILSVGMRVVLAHRGYPLSWEQKSRPLQFGIAVLVFATLTRIGARFAPESYLGHLATAGAVWMLGLLVWGAIIVRRILIDGPGPMESPLPIQLTTSRGASAQGLQEAATECRANPS